METKICRDCKILKSIDLFNWKNKKTGKYQPWCKDCWSKRNKIYYERNRAYHIKKALKRKAESHAKVLDYLSNHPCVDCGESDLIVLTFDHIRDKKRTEICKMLSCAWHTIETEIAKCDVRCFNCHIRRTALQFGWRRSHSKITEP